MPNSTAFKYLLIVPQLTDKISKQKIYFNSPYGEVGISWTHKENSRLQIEVIIPVNTKADVILPVSANDIVYESGKEISRNSDIKILSRQPDHLRLLVGAGKYIFEMSSLGSTK